MQKAELWSKKHLISICHAGPPINLRAGPIRHPGGNISAYNWIPGQARNDKLEKNKAVEIQDFKPPQ